MARASFHSEDDLLDAARAVVVERGPRAATVAAVREVSGAPIGSIYHRFGSLDELLARTWMRAARRSQAAALAVDAPDAGDAIDAIVEAAVAVYDFCLDNRDDAVLLASFRREDLARAELPDELHRELEQLNDPVLVRLRRHARLLYGRATKPAIDLLLVALVDLPYAFTRRYLDGGERPPATQRERLRIAARALLEAG